MPPRLNMWVGLFFNVDSLSCEREHYSVSLSFSHCAVSLLWHYRQSKKTNKKTLYSKISESCFQNKSGEEDKSYYSCILAFTKPSNYSPCKEIPRLQQNLISHFWTLNIVYYCKYHICISLNNVTLNPGAQKLLLMLRCFPNYWMKRSTCGSSVVRVGICCSANEKIWNVLESHCGEL